jgi:hypothetical protein
MTCRYRGGAYDHWYCQRQRFHFGAHRYNNYTWTSRGYLAARFRYLWRLTLWKVGNGHPWRRPLRPRARCTYNPLPHDHPWWSMRGAE